MKLSDKASTQALNRLWKSLKASRATRYRIDTGQRFQSMRPLFLAIYKHTKLTPNDVLGIPPKAKAKP